MKLNPERIGKLIYKKKCEIESELKQYDEIEDVQVHITIMNVKYAHHSDEGGEK